MRQELITITDFSKIYTEAYKYYVMQLLEELVINQGSNNITPVEIS